MKKNKTSEKIIAYIFALFFILPFLIFGIYETINIQGKIFSDEYIKTIATISNIEYYYTEDNMKGCDTYIDYIANGEKYKNIKFNISGPSMKIGDEYKIYYKVENPKEILSASNIFFGPVFLIIGLLMMIFGFIIPLKKTLKKDKKIKNLLKNGKQIFLDVYTIEYNVNTYCFYAKCKYIDEYNNTYILRSEETRNDLNNYFQFRNENLKLKAYINPNNPRDYYIPIEMLFEKNI